MEHQIASVWATQETKQMAEYGHGLLARFVEDIKKEFFYRLKDETQPAEKEFSYIGLLDILGVVLLQYGVTDKDFEPLRKAADEKIKKLLAGYFGELSSKLAQDENF
jgi:hypothetical protein